jgi:hypothetical protein
MLARYCIAMARCASFLGCYSKLTQSILPPGRGLCERLRAGDTPGSTAQLPRRSLWRQWANKFSHAGAGDWEAGTGMAPTCLLGAG